MLRSIGMTEYINLAYVNSFMVRSLFLCRCLRPVLCWKSGNRGPLTHTLPLNDAWQSVQTYCHQDKWTVARSWHIRDGNRSVCISPDPNISRFCQPATRVAHTRRELAPSFVETVFRMAISILLRARVPIVAIHEEHIVPIDGAVSVVGVLTAVDERTPRFEASRWHGAAPHSEHCSTMRAPSTVEHRTHCAGPNSVRNRKFEIPKQIRPETAKVESTWISSNTEFSGSRGSN